MIFLEGDPAHEVLVLLAGELKVSVGTTDGREVVLDVFGPGTLVGELSVIDGGTRSATVSALTPVEVLAVPAAAFRNFLSQHPPVMSALLVDVVGRLRTRVRHQLEFGAGDALGRVCARLVELAERYGEPDGDVVLLRCPISQADWPRGPACPARPSSSRCGRCAGSGGSTTRVPRSRSATRNGSAGARRTELMSETNSGPLPI